MEKKPSKFYCVNHFSRTNEIAKFRMINFYLDVSDTVHANERTKQGNCLLHVNIWNFLLMLFCFMMKKDHLSKSCYFGLSSRMIVTPWFQQNPKATSLTKKMEAILILISIKVYLPVSKTSFLNFTMNILINL